MLLDWLPANCTTIIHHACCTLHGIVCLNSFAGQPPAQLHILPATATCCCIITQYAGATFAHSTSQLVNGSMMSSHVLHVHTLTNYRLCNNAARAELHADLLQLSVSTRQQSHCCAPVLSTAVVGRIEVAMGGAAGQVEQGGG